MDRSGPKVSPMICITVLQVITIARNVNTQFYNAAFEVTYPGYNLDVSVTLA